ncbi:MAG TPA: hypothetical protein VFG87_21220 [Amycolatopsis sp.]|jgi:hypothetical protein|nr:hypothetical protein [Amycolatopsis sp.]
MKPIDPRLTAAALLVLTAVNLLLAGLDVHSALRLYLSVAFVVLAPGWAMTARLRIGTPALAWITAIAAGLSLTLLVAQVMVSTHWWHPTAAFLVLSALTFLALLAHLIRPPAETRVA